MAAVSLGCSGGSSSHDAAATADAPPSPYAVQLMTAECAPDDGPALMLVLTDESDENCRITDMSVAIEISIWTVGVQAPATVRFSETEPLGFARVCPGGTPPCDVASGGELYFERFTAGVEAAGSWRLDIGDIEMSGTFDAAWCEPTQPLICG